MQDDETSDDKYRKNLVSILSIVSILFSFFYVGCDSDSEGWITFLYGEKFDKNQAYPLETCSLKAHSEFRADYKYELAMARQIVLYNS